MKDLPIIAKIVVNILLYVFYTVILSFVVGLLIPIAQQLIGLSILDPSKSVNQEFFSKLQIFLAVFMLLVTLVFRKFFYVALGSDETEEKINQIGATKKQKLELDDEEEIKIYVEKEIKK